MRKYKIFNKKISGPFTIPSGIVATELSIIEKIANEIPEIGILTTKALDRNQKRGIENQSLLNIPPFLLSMRLV